MDFNFYIFGTPNGFDLYSTNKKNTSSFKRYDDGSDENVKLTISRSGGLISYTYLRYHLQSANELSDAFGGSAFLGMTVEFDSLYCSDVEGLYQLFEEVYTKVILKNGILLKKITNEETKELLIFYQYNKISDAVKLVFKNKEETFIRFIKNSEGYTIYDGDKRYYYSENNPIQNNTITIKYEKKILPADVISKIEITQKGTRYIVSCKLEKNEITPFLRIVILVVCVLLGYMIPNNKKIKKH